MNDKSLFRRDCIMGYVVPVYDEEYLRYKQAEKAELKRAERSNEAIKILCGSAGKDKPEDKKRDTYTKADNSLFMTYGKPEPVALYDGRYDASNYNFSLYFSHYNDPKALLDAYNFSRHSVQVGAHSFMSVSSGNGEVKSLGFIYNGVVQHIPLYAMPKIDPATCPEIKAYNNHLSISDRSYYSYKATSGKSYVCVSSDRSFQHAPSEAERIREEEKTSGKCCTDLKEVGGICNLVTCLKSGYGTLYNNGDNAKNLKIYMDRLGIKPGVFTVENGEQEFIYHYDKNHGKIRLLCKPHRFLTTNYVEKGYSVGDKAYIYGLECTVGEDGFLIFPQKIEYTDYRCKFFKDSAEKTWDELSHAT